MFWRATPRSLDMVEVGAGRAAFESADLLITAGVPLNSTLGDAQYIEKGGVRYPMASEIEVFVCPEKPGLLRALRRPRHTEPGVRLPGPRQLANQVRTKG